MSDIITCPSGLSGRIRGMKVREERILADRKLAKRGGQMDRLLAACWEETLDAGPYDFGDKDIDWGLVLQGDRFFALLQLRTLTYGPEYAFAVNCQSEVCRTRIEWELNLHDLPCRQLSDQSRAAFEQGNRFEATLPDAGKRVWFRLFTGADERKLPQLRRNAGERLLSAMLAFRVVEVEGVDARDKRRFIEDLFQLCWRQHGGSGLGAGVNEALAMTISDRDWFLERIGEQRSREAKAIEKAGKRGARK